MPIPRRRTSAPQRRATNGAFALVTGLVLALCLATSTAAEGAGRHGGHRHDGWRHQRLHDRGQARGPHRDGRRGRGEERRRLREERVDRVLQAAWHARGRPYVYGAAGPGSFDCSGFTRWAWAHGGVRLPHNSAAQYRAVRWHVGRRDLQPGDLLFFYSPISHVGLYLGHGRMIDAEHTGTRIHPHRIWWPSFTAAARPT